MKSVLMVMAVGAMALAAGQATGETRAFPGAEGFGAQTRGGRGGRVIAVTSLAEKGPGTLRAAVEAEGPRTVVFRVAGIIDLRKKLTLRNPYITIAGQTAPGGGICIRGERLEIACDEVIVRYLRFRPGNILQKSVDAVNVHRGRNIILDHLSTSWAVDEVLSVSGEGCDKVTVQWCLITESLNKSFHNKGAHGYGSLLRTDGDVTFHHNLYAHHESRCPRPGTYGKARGILLDFRNNVIYDWGGKAGYTSEDKATLNYIGNYLKPGPSTRDRKYAFHVGGPATLMHFSDNHLEGAGKGDEDNWLLVKKAKPGNRADSPFPVSAVATDSAEKAFERVLVEAGATLPARDAVDKRVISEVREGKGRIIDSQEDVGGWPVYD